ncbi:hypothetical protein C2845_PM02G35300 [Panicum miliaceum]|uniref:Uncharacterized protein n=1 Tax=Panicum miliaceum TaxID=4540 RepID=A0A3L6S7A8_PANMI|nr:hypothetical protein C2845_PM02G35300 [Panicum miliaceum]
MTMRMVVTSDGYLGARLCAAVAGAGHDVRVFVLHGVDVSGLLLAADVAYGDVANEESLVAAFGGCDAVFDNRRGRRGVAPGRLHLPHCKGERSGGQEGGASWDSIRPPRGGGRRTSITRGTGGFCKTVASLSARCRDVSTPAMTARRLRSPSPESGPEVGDPRNDKRNERSSAETGMVELL